MVRAHPASASRSRYESFALGTIDSVICWVTRWIIGSNLACWYSTNVTGNKPISATIASGLTRARRLGVASVGTRSLRLKRKRTNDMSVILGANDLVGCGCTRCTQTVPTSNPGARIAARRGRFGSSYRAARAVRGAVQSGRSDETLVGRICRATSPTVSFNGGLGCGGVDRPTRAQRRRRPTVSAVQISPRSAIVRAKAQRK